MVYFALVSLLSLHHEMPSKLRAATFETIRTFPGVRVRPGAVVVLGRPGVALSRPGTFGDHEMIFDARTFRYLGGRSIVHLDDGRAYVQVTAVERWGIADRLKEVPEVTCAP